MNPWEEILAHATRQRVKDERDLMVTVMENWIENIESENARLREALGRIWQGEPNPETWWQSIAKDALEGK